MLKTGHEEKRFARGQAAIELAVFGAILIFVLGTIMRSAVGNGFAQNENFKAMRMALLSSWQYSKEFAGQNGANTSHNGASVLFVEDRLSPDFNKYGPLDRNPFIASGAGTFSYELEYPWAPGDGFVNLIPIMDVYVNGQHFPFSTATYVLRRKVSDLVACSSNCQGSSANPQCLQNQINRNQREWVGGTVDQNQFNAIIDLPATVAGCPATITASTPAGTTIACDAWAIFNELTNEGFISPLPNLPTRALVTSSTMTNTFINWLESTFEGTDQRQVNQIQKILQKGIGKRKLFYIVVANGSKKFSPAPPVCTAPTCVNKALTSTLITENSQGQAGYWNGIDPTTGTDHTGDMMYDLQRLGDYSAVDAQFGPPVSSCSDVNVSANSLRCNIAWQWAATPGTSDASIGLDVSQNQYPQYDIDGRLKQVTVYGIGNDTNGNTIVSYEDYQGGDIDTTWDVNSCGPKPGLQSDSQIFTFTKNAQNATNGDGGTYLQIKEGKLYNPETDQFVRSANKRDTIDLIQRTIQLSNNTGRFCSGGSATPPKYVQNCDSNGCVNSPDLNPVEVCIPAGPIASPVSSTTSGPGAASSSGGDCFNGDTNGEQNIKQTCYDENANIIYVRSRLEDRRGHFWMTDTSGELSVH